MIEGKGFAKRVTRENIKDFAPLLKKQSEGSSETSGSGGSTSPTPVDPEFAAAEGQFDGKSIKPAYKHKPPKSSSSVKPKKTSAPTTKAPSAAPAPAPPAAATSPVAKGTLLWQKELSKTDAQRVSGHRTGCVKLSEAKFIDPKTGKEIDWIVYFRNDAFSALTWRPTGRILAEEEADITFDVSLEGKSIGEYELKLIHKPSGESNQRNVPTHLLWGELTSEIMKNNYSYKILRLYAPTLGTKSPYYLDLSAK